ncbi:alpha-D-xyloside xylohydrolase [Anaerobacterium chartisolvens]|uniref:Alpha-D-xyloside xylohydrolase n=1 Tax=Anaerobacterium chartisolvens TaxID=1297424 RepID=A0A369APV9_9FIRM|nr:TIM-barrel domain-containing protein [Anaerobacterium chartisolvens]RCX11155.1 alpha-D-xyloside xylohydrolase [Anaerobacterium chartisolvens]
MGAEDKCSARIMQVSENIVKVVYGGGKEETENSILISEDFKPESNLATNKYLCEGGRILFKNKRGEVVLEETGHSLTEKEVFTYYVDGEPIVKYKQTANGEVTYVENAVYKPSGTAYEGKLTFSITEDEGIYGLGQHEDGVYNYNGRKEYLFQANMKISIPFMLSSRNYGILIDTEGAMIFDSERGKVEFTIDTTDKLSYYVITGESFEEIIKELRCLTGRAQMLPRWAYGYVQSKERYKSAEELVNIVLQFRKAGIPIDCIVQDWLSWEDGLWGEKRVDKKRYPDLKELINKLHKEHVKLMVSVWPNMAEGGSNHQEFKEKGLLLPNSNTYNAYSKEARDVYWRQYEDEWFSAGADALWCDNSEPFSDADWSGETKRPEEVRYQLIVDESKKFMDWTRLNSYGLFHSKGIYENWRKTNNSKRVTNLTRSSYLSGQQHGAVLWSGDTSAKWSALRKQITEGIKFSMSGMPYWTLDIGGFFTVKDKWENRGCNCSDKKYKLWFWDGDYNDGVGDLGYRELYVRWLQYGAFLPMFRSHGTDTPREPWNFGEPGDIFYDTILKFIKLRYRLLPYIYSTAADVYQNHSTMIRSLMFDFAKDKNVKDIDDSFMFGKAFLVCPVTEPMYYEANSVPLVNTEKTREVYLPEHTQWFDFWTDKQYGGGQAVTCKAELDTIPLFVKAGSIVPLSRPLMYADEKNGEVSELIIYGGEDGEFVLYNDEGDNYSYEKGNFSAIKLTYRDNEKTLTFGKACGGFRYQENFKIKLIGGGEVSKTIEFVYKGEEEAVKF